eukprot:m.290261 g.290261  ORF g.290261 m.290261 type:complete len:220 (-) comp15816_c0_seq16:3918-4577(-)
MVFSLVSSLATGSACWEKRIALSAAHALQPPVLPFKPNVQHLGEVTVLVTGNFVVGAMIEQPLHDNEYSLVQPCSDQARFSWLHQFVTTVRFEPSLETMQSSCLCHRSCPCALPPWTISRTSESMDPALQPNQPRSRPIYILQTAFDVEVFLQVSLQRLFNSQDLDLGVILDYETSIIDVCISQKYSRPMVNQTDLLIQQGTHSNNHSTCSTAPSLVCF